jgi:hypothetical protein
LKFDCSSEAVPQTVLFPWIQPISQSSLRVLAISPSTKLFNSDRISDLIENWRRLTLGGLGLACNIPAISSEVIHVEPSSAKDDEDKSVMSVGKLSVDDNFEDMFKYATKGHIDASDQLLTVLSESVRVRVLCQDLRCHCCLLEMQREKRIGAFMPADNVSSSNSVGTDNSECSVSTTEGTEVQQTDDAKYCNAFNEVKGNLIWYFAFTDLFY